MQKQLRVTVTIINLLVLLQLLHACEAQVPASCEHIHTYTSLLWFAGYEGTFVCEPDNHKALEMYKEWKSGKKPSTASH
jgi:hypothetical protein